MPYPAKLTTEAILGAAEHLIDEQGLEGLSLRTLADVLQVRAPSLYRYFPDKESLLRALSGRFFLALSQGIGPARSAADLAHAYRDWALAHPRRYAVLFRDAPEAERAGEVDRLRAAEPLLEAVRGLSPEPPLAAARALWAYLHGSVALELQFEGQTRPGLDAEEAFEAGLQALLAGFARAGPQL
jgi:AcrR family transcriptional regulator